MKNLRAVILAAGQGTRMKSSIPKVLHRIMGRPMLGHVVRVASRLKPEKIVVVVGSENGEMIKRAFNGQVEFAVQYRPLGTAHALLSGGPVLGDFKGDILVLNGDTPLLRAETLRSFIRRHRRRKNSLSILSFIAEEPKGYGRILRDSSGCPVMIREETDLSPKEREIKEVNAGVYLMDRQAYDLLKSIKKNKKKGEYYLTDILVLAYKAGLSTDVFPLAEEEELMGVNTKEELLKAQKILRIRTVRKLIEADVGFMDEERVYIDEDVIIGPGSYIYPNVFIEGQCNIGSDCVIYPNVRIINSRIGDSVTIRENTTIENAVVEDNVVIGPFARIRPDSLIKRDARIGNFVEIKRSTIGRGTKAQHLSYIGDATVGEGVNIGAGTITCNYDGLRKHRTVIEDGVFVGSDTQLVAPVKIGKGAYVGAGSTITEDVPPGALALSRTQQKNIENWVKKRKK